VVESSNVIVDRPVAESGFAMLARGGDFADGVIAYDAERLGADHLFTFDRTFAQLSDPARVRLIEA
jgi:predicted nucleic acid-binding protein